MNNFNSNQEFHLSHITVSLIFHFHLIVDCQSSAMPYPPIAFLSALKLGLQYGAVIMASNSRKQTLVPLSMEIGEKELAADRICKLNVDIQTPLDEGYAMPTISCMNCPNVAP